MADETNQAGDGTTDEQRAKDDEARRMATLQIEAQEAHTMAKIENNLAGASNSQFRRVCLERYGFIPI